MSSRFAKFFSRLPVFWALVRNSKKARRNRPGDANNVFITAVLVEELERRSMLSATSISQVVAQPTIDLQKMATSPGGSGYTPQQLQAAYGFNLISHNGAGQTIAIVDAYDDPTIANDLKAFDAAFGLADPPSFKVVSQTGSTTNLPSTDPSSNTQSNWEVEEALDVEWAHAMAPGANIILVEANSASMSDLLTAVRTAASLPGVSVVSMSWGGSEFSTESQYDSYFTTPAGHQGVTFIASGGDSGAPAGFPAYSPNVLAVGGTTLNLSSTGSYISETGWSGSGGGISLYESQPSYQAGTVTQTTTKRTAPDVAFDANPSTGVPVYDSFSWGTSSPWAQIGGTSLSAPAWGAVVSIINQARAQNGLTTLDGRSQTLPMLYQLRNSNPSAFHDITSGNNGYSAGSGYDLVTGLGSPVMNVLVPAMAGTSSNTNTSKLVFFSGPSIGTAGQTLGAIRVGVTTQSGQVITTDNSTVRLTITSGPGNFSSSSVVTATVVNGIATFSNVSLNTAGTYTIQLSDSAGATSTSIQVTIVAAAASKLVFQQVPTSANVGTNLGAVTVAVQDQYGNLVTTYNSSVTIAVATGPGTFAAGSTTTVNAVNGYATFNSLMLSTAGTYTLVAGHAGLTSATSSALVIRSGLSAPQNVSISAVSSTIAQLSWSAVWGAQGYRIFQVIGSQRVALGTVSSSTLSTQLSSLTAGSSYSFLVEAFSGTSTADSHTVSITMPTGVNNSLTLSATLLSTSSVQLNWNAIAGATNYIVFYSLNSRTYMLGVAGSSTTSLSISGLSAGVNYQFRIEEISRSSILYSNWVTVNSANFTRRSVAASVSSAATNNKKGSAYGDYY